MKKVFAVFKNHFDLLFRRCWDKSYDYDGKKWLSYSELEALIISKNIKLAKAGKGAYELEQSLSMRSYLKRIVMRRSSLSASVRLFLGQFVPWG